MLALENINYQYPRTKSRRFRLRDISLFIDPGQIFTLLGPNGAGKTSIIRIISSLILPESGKVTINDHDLRRSQYRARKSLGLVIGEERTFYYRLSGKQNLEFFGGLYGIGRKTLKARVEQVLDMVGLSKDADLQFMRYSTGMKKRLNMARALVHEPTVFLFDEPNSGVDPESAQKLREIIFSLKRQGATILLTTHNMDEAERMSDVIAFLREGRIIKTGPLSDFKSHIARKHLVVELQSGEFIDGDTQQLLRERLNMDSVLVDFPEGRREVIIDYNGSVSVNEILAEVFRLGIAVKGVTTKEPSLEDVFIKLANE